MSTQGYVYILEFDRPLGNPDNRRGQAKFYVGWAKEVRARVNAHKAGCGAAITRAANERGIDYQVVAVIPGGRDLERRIKNQHNTARFLRQFQRQQAQAVQ